MEIRIEKGKQRCVLPTSDIREKKRKRCYQDYRRYGIPKYAHYPHDPLIIYIFRIILSFLRVKTENLMSNLGLM